MKRNSLVFIAVITVFLTAVVFLWEFLPVSVLKDIDPGDITSIQVISSSGNPFELTDQDNISELIRNVQRASFQKKAIASVPGPWYRLAFLDDDQEIKEYFLCMQFYR